MVSRLVPGSALAAIAGAAIFVAASSSPSPAFTLSSPSLEQSVLGADIQDVYWCRWGRCGGWGWHRWGYWHPYHAYYFRPYSTATGAAAGGGHGDTAAAGTDERGSGSGRSGAAALASSRPRAAEVPKLAVTFCASSLYSQLRWRAITGDYGDARSNPFFGFTATLHSIPYRPASCVWLISTPPRPVSPARTPSGPRPRDPGR